MATDLTPPFPDRRKEGRGDPGYRVRRVMRDRDLEPCWEVTGERDGETWWLADFRTETDAKWWTETMAREWHKRAIDDHGN